MEELFYSWFIEHTEKLRQEGIITDLISEPTKTNNPTIFADHLSSTRMGRVTVWNSGAIYIQILDQISGETVYDKHFEIKEKNCVESILNEYFAYLLR